MLKYKIPQIVTLTHVNLPHYQHANYFCVSSEINTEFIM